MSITRQQIVVPGADFSALGLGRVSADPNQIAIEQMESLLWWMDPDPQWITTRIVDRINGQSFTGKIMPDYGIGGQATLSFAAASIWEQMIVGPDMMPIDADYTLIFVAMPSSTAATQYILGSVAPSTLNITHVLISNTAAVQIGQNGQTLAADPSILWSAGMPRVLVARYDYSATRMEMWLDGALVASSDSFAAGNAFAGLQLGGAAQATPTFTGHLGDVLLFDSALEHNDRASVEAHLKSKYGIV